MKQQRFLEGMEQILPECVRCCGMILILTRQGQRLCVLHSIYRKCFAIAKCPSEGLESPTVVGAQAANELLNIAGVKASFVLTPYNKEVYVSARAIDEVNVQIMMERMGGGGHLNIAGAQLKESLDEAELMLKAIIDQLYEEGEFKES